MIFELYGRISWSVGSCHDDRGESVNEEFEIPEGPNAEKKAIEKAREIVKGLHEKYSHGTDYHLVVELRVVTRRIIWETHFEDETPATPAMPAVAAKPAEPAVPAHLCERTLI